MRTRAWRRAGISGSLNASLQPGAKVLGWGGGAAGVALHGENRAEGA